MQTTDLHPDASTVEDLKSFHFLEEAIPDLKKELPTYLAFADGVAEVSLVDWWMRHEQKLPCWAEASCRASHPREQLKGSSAPSKILLGMNRIGLWKTILNSH